MARITHFDISGDQPEQLIPFYKEIFGWKFEKWNGPMEYWMITTGSDDQPGINGGLNRRNEDSRVINTMDVEDIDGVLEEISARGGKIVTPKGTIPGIGWYAQFADPEGNQMGVMQSDEDAK